MHSNIVPCNSDRLLNVKTDSVIEALGPIKVSKELLQRESFINCKGSVEAILMTGVYKSNPEGPPIFETLIQTETVLNNDSSINNITITRTNEKCKVERLEFYRNGKRRHSIITLSIVDDPIYRLSTLRREVHLEFDENGKIIKKTRMKFKKRHE